MIVSNKILGAFAAIIATSSGVDVDHNQTNIFVGGSGSDDSGNTGDMVMIGSGKGLTSTTASLICPAQGDNSGAESTHSFNFNGKSVIVDLDSLTGTNSNHKLVIQGPSDNVGISIMKWGSTYQAKAFLNDVDLMDSNHTGTSNELKIAHSDNTVHWYANGVEFGRTLFSSTNNMKVKLLCGNESGIFHHLYVNGTALDMDVAGASGSSGLQSISYSGSGNITNHPDYAYVQKAHNYFKKMTVQSSYSDLSTIRTFDSGGPWINASDVYDNGITAIAYTVMGRATDAGNILNTYLQIYQGLEDWGNTNDVEKKLLTQRVYTTNLLPHTGVEPSAEDLGNNSYMMLAFCKYFNQFMNDGASEAQLLPYYDRAYKMLDYIWRTRKVSNGGLERYYAREVTNQTWAAAEHHINLYALGKCMAQHIPAGYNATLIDDFTAVADNFVREMWDSDDGAYRIGTYPNSSIINEEIGYPVDLVSWRYLADAGYRSDADDNSTFNFMLENHYVVETAFDIPNFAGVKFTANYWAEGQQTENTGAILIAMKKHGGFPTQVAQVQSSLKALFDQQGTDGGLYAHNELWSDICDGETGEYCNTGLSWSYFRVPHTASTAYGILGIIGENPYQTGKSDYIRVQNVIIP